VLVAKSLHPSATSSFAWLNITVLTISFSIRLTHFLNLIGVFDFTLQQAIFMEQQSCLLTTPLTSSLQFLCIASGTSSLSCSTYVEQARRQVEAAPCLRITWTPPSWTRCQPVSWAPHLCKTQHLWSPALLAWGSALNHHFHTCIPADISPLHSRQVCQCLTQQDDLHHPSKGMYVPHVWLYPVEELI